MLHDIVSLVTVFSEVVGAWLKGEIGASDYRIVRLFFFSTFAACTAFGLMRTAASFAYVIARVISLYLPPYPEISLMLGWITPDEYETRAYRLIRRAARGVAALLAWADQKRLVGGGNNDYTH